ncbi:hypothetical protein KGP93_37950, partial [Burkholderia multivorans]|nr:hypothetical protein [Burkholderia multivorans]
VQALARFYRHFFLAFAWHNVAPWPSVYASHTKVRIGSGGRVNSNGLLPRIHSERADTYTIYWGEDALLHKGWT